MSASNKLYTLEVDRPLPESLVWDLQPTSERSTSTTEWDSTLACAFIACRYARLILSILNDWKEYLIAQSPIGSNFVPVYIIQVGAGSGELGYLILKKLWELRKFWPDFGTCLSIGTSNSPVLSQVNHDFYNEKVNKTSDLTSVIFPFKFVLTDVDPRNVDFWKSQNCLQQFMDIGLLDYGVFDTERDNQIYLQRSQRKISKLKANEQEMQNTLSVAIFNGILSGMKQDAFQIRNGELYRGYCTTKVPLSDCFPAAKDDDANVSFKTISHLSWEWKYKKTKANQFKHDADIDKLLGYYKDYFSENQLDGSFLIPTDAINAIRKLESFSAGKLIVITGDKAFNAIDELVGLRDPIIAIPGSCSFIVNLHAIGLYTQFMSEKNTFALSSPYLEEFKCGCFVFTPNLISSFEELRLQWEDGMKHFGATEFSSLQRAVKEELRAPDTESLKIPPTTTPEMANEADQIISSTVISASPTPSLRLALTLVRLSEYDPEVFYKFRRAVVDKCPYASNRMQHDIRVDAQRIGENYYPLANKKADVAFELGRVMMGIKEFALAINFFQDSQKNFGEHHINWYNMGICYRYVDKMEKALNCFDRSLELQPQYLEAIRWKTMVENELNVNDM